MLRRRSRKVKAGIAIVMTAAMGVMGLGEIEARRPVRVASVDWLPVQRDRRQPFWLANESQTQASPRLRPDLKQSGQLAVAQSPLLANGSLVNSYRLTLTESREIAIDLRSKAFDA
ncbi:MAG: hypothetical protein AAFY15_10745, partial [Cyanobacteria bacterium J06648_11]